MSQIIIKITELDPIELDLFIAKNIYQEAWIDDDTGNVCAVNIIPAEEVDDFSPQIHQYQAAALALEMDMQIVVKFKKTQGGLYQKQYHVTHWHENTVTGFADKDLKRAISITAGLVFGSALCE